MVFPQPAPGRPFRAQRAAGAAFVGVIWTAAAASLAVESRTTLGKRWGYVKWLSFGIVGMKLFEP